MSSDHLDAQPPVSTPTPVRLSLWGILFAAMMLMFAAFTFITVVLPRPRTLEQADAQRRGALIGNRREQQKEWLSSYGWVDEEKKIAHIPVEEAMKKFVEQQQKTQQ